LQSSAFPPPFSSPASGIVKSQPGIWAATSTTPGWLNSRNEASCPGFGSHAAQKEVEQNILPWVGGKLFSLRIAEKVSVSLCVLIFFWGSFALVAAATGRAPWTLSPLIAMFCYGWTFHNGFFNYYVSLGLAFCALSLFWRGTIRERIFAIALTPLVMLAQPFGVALLIGGAAYILLAESISRKHHVLLLATTLVFLWTVHSYIWHHWPAGRSPTSLFFFNGTDQLAVFGYSYHWLMLALLIFAALLVASDLRSRRHIPDLWPQVSVSLQLFLAAEMAIFLLPSYILLPQYQLAVSSLTQRLTLISAVFACCVLGVVVAHRWHFVGYAVIAFAFFALLYRDTLIVNKMEEKAERIVATLPQGSIVVSTNWAPPGSRILAEHIVDRACIGHCFSYANYEPPSGQFRIRAKPGNRFVTARIYYKSEEDLQRGNAYFDFPNQPAYEIYTCGSARSDLCFQPINSNSTN
jgi:hypothetical protein